MRKNVTRKYLDQITSQIKVKSACKIKSDTVSMILFSPNKGMNTISTIQERKTISNGKPNVT